MKKLYLFCSFMIFVTLTMAQEIQLTFDAENIEDKIDSIIVLNHRTGQVLKLLGNEILVLNNISTNTGFTNGVIDEGFIYPNPTDGFSYLNYISSEQGDVELRVYNSSGHLLGNHSNLLPPGNHQFKVTFPMNGFYVVSLMKNQDVKNFKAINLGKNQQDFQIHYMGINGNGNENDMVEKSVSVNKSMNYREGDILHFTLYSANMIAIMTETPTISKNLKVNFHKCIDPDNRNYKTVKIGDQIWMAENLAYLPSVSPSSQGSASAPHYYVNGYQGIDVAAAKQHANYKTYGVLYNWPAAMAGAASSSANPSKVQGVCPAGWHLPSDAEWKQLEMALGMTRSQADASGLRGNNQGTQLKTTSGWASNGNGTNTSGFSALPGGCRFDGIGTFHSVGNNGYWWSSTELGSSHAWFRGLDKRTDYVYVERVGSSKAYGISVRCVRD